MSEVNTCIKLSPSKILHCMTYNMFHNNLVCNTRVTAENFTATESTVKECTPGQMVQNLMDTLKMTRKKDLGHSHSQVATNLRFVQSIN